MLALLSGRLQGMASYCWALGLLLPFSRIESRHPTEVVICERDRLANDPSRGQGQLKIKLLHSLICGPMVR